MAIKFVGFAKSFPTEGCNFATALRRWAAPQQSPNKFGSAFGLHHRCIRKTKHKKGTGNGNEKKIKEL